MSRRPTPKIEVSAYGCECTREKFEETSQRPVRWLLSTFWYRATMRDARWRVREESAPTAVALGIATVADDSSSGMARSVTRVQLGASQRSWHGALFRLGETRFVEGRGNVRRLNLKHLERYVSLRKGRAWSSGFRKNFRSYGNGILRHELVEYDNSRSWYIMYGMYASMCQT